MLSSKGTRMAASSDMSKELQDAIRHVTGGIKVARRQIVKMETRTDKFEKKALAFSACRLFVVSAKPPHKLEHKFHYLNIIAIESRKPNQLSIRINGDKTFSFRTLETDTEDVDLMIIHVGTALKTIFPNMSIERLIPRIEVYPPERVTTMHSMFREIEARDPGPCGGFSNMYKCMCDLHHLPYREEVAWDVDTIYLSHDTKELSLQDFDHLNPKDLVPIIAALEYNPWFNKIIARGNKLLPETAEQLLQVMKKTTAIEELVLDGVGIKGDFAQQLSIALTSNVNCPLRVLDISNNQIEDRGLNHLTAPIGKLSLQGLSDSCDSPDLLGLNHLSGPLSKVSHGIVELNLSKTGISSKGINSLAQTLAFNKVTPNTLTKLCLSENPLRGEEPQYFFNYLSQPNALTHLDLSGTEISLENAFNALKQGCCSTLESLHLDRNPFSLKRSRDPNVQPSFMHFFQRTSALKKLSLSECKLPPEALKKLLLGLSCNENLLEMEFILSSNELKQAGADVIAALIAEVRCIADLDVSDNGFDDALPRMLKHLKENRSIRTLAIGKNFSPKPKHIPRQLQAVVEMIQDEESPLTSLSLADSRLRHETCIIVNALGSAHRLESLDLSGNAMGDAVARMLSKALQINSRISRLYLDRNDLSAQGFQDIAMALEKNYTLKVMPVSVIDAANAIKLQPQKTEEALRKMESCLLRNQSRRTQKFQSEQAYRLQQGFILSFAQQMDKLQAKTLDTINTLRHQGHVTPEDLPALDVAEGVCREADNAKMLLPKLRDVALRWSAPGNPIEQCLSSVSEEITRLICDQMEQCVTALINVTSSTMPEIMRRELMDELAVNCRQKYVISQDLVDREFVEHLYQSIMNKMSELNFSTSAHLTDRVIDEAIESLNKSYTKLSNLIELRKKQHRTVGSMTSVESLASEGNASHSHSSGKASPSLSYGAPKSPSLHSMDSLTEADGRPPPPPKTKRTSNVSKEEIREAETLFPPSPVIHPPPSPRPPKPKSKNAVAFQDADKLTAPSTDWRHYTLTRKSRPQSSIIHTTSAETDSQSNASSENLSLKDVAPQESAPPPSEPVDIKGGKGDARKASTDSVDSASVTSATPTVSAQNSVSVSEAGSLLASVMGVWESTSGESLPPAENKSPEPSSPFFPVEPETPPIVAFDAAPSASAAAAAPPDLPALEDHRPLAHVGKDRPKPKRNNKMHKPTANPNPALNGHQENESTNIDHFYGGRPPPPEPEDQVHMNGPAPSPGAGTPPSIPSSKPKSKDLVTAKENSEVSSDPKEDSQKSRSWWPFKSKDKKKEESTPTPTTPTTPSRDDDLQWHYGLSSAGAPHGRAGPVPPKKPSTPPAPPTSPPPDDDDDDDDHRASPRPVSKATPMGLPGGVLAEMREKRGLKSRVNEHPGSSNESSTSSRPTEVARPVIGPGMLKPASRKTNDGLTLEVSGGNDASAANGAKPTVKSAKETESPNLPSVVCPPSTLPNLLSVNSPSSGFAFSGLGHMDGGSLDSAPHPSPRPPPPHKPCKPLKPATAPKPASRPSQFPSPTGPGAPPTPPTPDGTTAPGFHVRRPVGSPSPPRPLPRASLLTISGQSTSAAPQPPSTPPPPPPPHSPTRSGGGRKGGTLPAFPSSKSPFACADPPAPSSAAELSFIVAQSRFGRQRSNAAVLLENNNNNKKPHVVDKKQKSDSLDSLDSGVVVSDFGAKIGAGRDAASSSASSTSGNDPTSSSTGLSPNVGRSVAPKNPSSVIRIPSSSPTPLTTSTSSKMASSVDSTSGLSASSLDKDRETPDSIESDFAAPDCLLDESGVDFGADKRRVDDEDDDDDDTRRLRPPSTSGHRRRAAVKRQGSSASGASWGGVGGAGDAHHEEDEVYL